MAIMFNNSILKTLLWLTLSLATPLAATPFRILTEHNPPAEYLDDNGQVAGVMVELVRQLQQQLNEPADIELMPWGRALSIARSQDNVMLFETVRTPEREHWFKWVGPVLTYRLALYGLKHRLATVDTEQLPGKLTACNYVNSITIKALNGLGFDEGRNLLLTSKTGDCLDMLLFERIDLIAVTEDAVAEFANAAEKAGYELVEVQLLAERQRYLAFSKDVSDERIRRWQQALEQSYRDGRMRALYQPVYQEALIRRLEEFAAQSRPALAR